MKINEKTLVNYASGTQVPDMEDWLWKRGEVIFGGFGKSLTVGSIELILV